MKPGIDCIGVGVGCLILNERGEVLLMKRSMKSKTDRGVWSRPGGAVEFGETVEDALKREIKEEVGVDIEIEAFLDCSNDLKVEDGIKKHWIALGFLARIVGGKAENLEPDKHDELGWFPLYRLPDGITEYTRAGIAALQAKKSV